MIALCMSQLTSLTCRYWIMYTPRVLGCVFEHLELVLCSVYAVAYEPSLGAIPAKLSLEIITIDIVAQKYLIHFGKQTYSISCQTTNIK